MIRTLMSRWNRDKLRNAELQALLAESEKALETTTISRDYSLSEVARLHAKVRTLSSQVVEAANKGIRFEEAASKLEADLKSVGKRYHSALSSNNDWANKYDKANAEAGELADELVEVLDKLSKLEAVDKANVATISRQSQTLKDNHDLIEELRSSLRDYVRANNDVVSENTRLAMKVVSVEADLGESGHRIVLAVAALTRDLPAKATSVKDETFSLN